MKQSLEFFTSKLGIPEEEVQQAFDVQREKGFSLIQALARPNTEEELSLLQKLGHELEMDFLFTLPSDLQTDFTALVPIAFLKKNIPGLFHIIVSGGPINIPIMFTT